MPCSERAGTSVRAEGLMTDDVFGAYVADRCLPDENIPAEKLTHIYYAFADITDGMIDADENDHIPQLVSLRERNPDLNVIVSVGGWGRCESFPEMAATAENRERFAESAVEFIRRYDLDGIDYDWEFPAEDEAWDLTAMLRTLRSALDGAGEEDGNHYLLTAALSNFPSHLAGVDLSAVHEYLDIVNLMTYDMLIDERSHHTNLHPSPLNPRCSVEQTVDTYLDSGVPLSKMVIGSGFYSRGTKRVDYQTLVESFIEKNGYTRTWDDEAKAPYLEKEGEFISYDDPESVRCKVDYLRERGLRGIMFWQYGHDPTHELIDAIHDRLVETKTE